MKKIFFSAAASGLLLIGLNGCAHHEESHHEEATYLISSPLLTDTVISKDYVSQIHAYRNIDIRALEKGYLQDIKVDEGQFVQKGQLMFQILPNIYEAEYQSAKAEAEVAEIEYKNTKMLAEQNVVSQNELAMSKAKYNKALAEMTLAETHLGFTTIRAPFDGIMDHLHVREGSMLEEGEELTSLSDNSKMWVYFNLPEAEYLEYMQNADHPKNQKVQLKLANNTMFAHEGTIETIEGEFDHATGNIQFRATFPNPSKLLRHGETGSVILNVPYTNALLIPQKATFAVLEKRYIFVVGEDHKVEQREIFVDGELPNLFIVKDGLKENEKILIDGIRMVHNGDVIHTRYQSPQDLFKELDLFTE
jgi:membrane fusion protein (multidrug efflux system)